MTMSRFNFPRKPTRATCSLRSGKVATTLKQTVKKRKTSIASPEQ
jgi:hypothetical protein